MNLANDILQNILFPYLLLCDIQKIELIYNTNYKNFIKDRNERITKECEIFSKTGIFTESYRDVHAYYYPNQRLHNSLRTLQFIRGSKTKR